MADIEKVKKGLKCCSAANTDRVCPAFECPYKNQDPRSENCCIDEMLDNGLAAIEELEKTVEDQAERIAIMEAEMPGWISASEKLPEEYELVLVWMQKSEHEIMHIEKTYQGDLWLNDHDYYFNTENTWWMPLPKPPKEGGGN